MRHRIKSICGSLQALEDRVIPFAGWPFPGGPATNPIVGTYGQYQDIKDGPEDLSVHFHEGIDFAVSTPNEGVLAVDTGYVHYIYKDAIPFNSFVVIRDDEIYTPGTTKKWTYKHIIPDAKLKLKDTVTKGVTILGTVVEVSQVIKDAGYPSHVHIDRGTGEDEFAPGARDRHQPRPNLNALSAFDPALDATAPTIEQILFRTSGSDEPGMHTVTNKRLGLTKETPRANANYFNTNGTIGSETYTLVGIQPDPLGGGTLPANSSPGIDIVANMYDRFGPANAPSSRKLNIATTSFSALGRRWAATTGTIASFNFKSIVDPKLVNYKYFLDFNRTRSIYSNDSTSDSKFIGPYYFTVTNTPSRTATFAAGGVFPESAKSNYWTTNAIPGDPWNAGSADKKATSNAGSEYPDDFYDVYVEAKDLSGNLTYKYSLVLLDNWRQSISLAGQGPFVAGKDIVVAEGSQFRPNQDLKFYVLPGPLVPAQLSGNTVLPAGASIGTIQTDGNGRFKNAKFANKAPAAGSYWLVADYDGDGFFTTRLDAAVRFTVNPAKLPNPMAAVPDTFVWSHGWAMEIGAPGVLATDESPNWADTTAVLHSGPSHGTLDLRSDGSFTYVPNLGGSYQDTFYYKLRVGGTSTDEVAVTLSITNSLPQPKSDEYRVVHDNSLILSVVDGPLRNDADWDGDILTAIASLSAQHGTASLSSDGSLTYTPNPGFVGVDFLNYAPADGTGTGDTATITIDVTNSAPEPVGDFYEVNAGNPLFVPFAEGVRINDVDEENDVISVSIPMEPELAPEHGTVVLNSNGSFTYTPDSGYTGYDYFFYTATDGMTAGDLGLVTLFVTNGSRIGDEVWHDLDENGLQDTGEPGLENITVRLIDSMDVIVAQDQTDEFGRYLFDVAPGLYRVVVTMPSWGAAGPANSGADDSADSDFDTTGATVQFLVAQGESQYEIDGGLTGIPPPPPSLLGGTIWMDMNGNSVRDGLENGMSGITVNLLDATGAIVAQTTSGTDGSYSFANLTPGQYRIQFIKPMGYSFVAANQGTNELADSDVMESFYGTTELFTFTGGTNLEWTAGLTVMGGP